MRPFGPLEELGTAGRIVFARRCRWNGQVYDLGSYLRYREPESLTGTATESASHRRGGELIATRDLLLSEKRGLFVCDDRFRYGRPMTGSLGSTGITVPRATVRESRPETGPGTFERGEISPESDSVRYGSLCRCGTHA